MRKPVIAGNWKMNKLNSEAEELIKKLIPLIKNEECDIVVCPVSTCLVNAVKVAKSSSIKVGSQNMYHKESGAYTGEISPLMVKDTGAEYVILGHSERRQYFGETDSEVNLKTKAAMNIALKPIVCVGETLEEREAGRTFEVIKTQMIGSLKDLSKELIDLLIIAYEPVWAIGTGKTATNDEANEAIKYIRSLIGEILGNEVAEKTRILYGGSVKGSNIKELMNMPEIDGALVGGASLDAEEFSKIINF